MRCLHCGKRLPLLKKLTGAEFCTDAHRVAYQQNQERLALSRLIDATHDTIPRSKRKLLAAPADPPKAEKKSKKGAPAGPGLCDTMWPLAFRPRNAALLLLHPGDPELAALPQFSPALVVLPRVTGFQLPKLYDPALIEKLRPAERVHLEWVVRARGAEHNIWILEPDVELVAGPAGVVPALQLSPDPEGAVVPEQAEPEVVSLKSEAPATEAVEQAEFLEPAIVPAVGIAGRVPFDWPWRVVDMQRKEIRAREASDYLEAAAPATLPRAVFGVEAAALEDVSKTPVGAQKVNGAYRDWGVPAADRVSMHLLRDVIGSRRLMHVVEGAFLAAARPSFPRVLGDIGVRLGLVGRLPVPLPLAKGGERVLSADLSCEALSPFLLPPKPVSIAPCEFRAPVAGLQALLLAARNPLGSRRVSAAAVSCLWEPAALAGSLPKFDGKPLCDWVPVLSAVLPHRMTVSPRVPAPVTSVSAGDALQPEPAAVASQGVPRVALSVDPVQGLAGCAATPLALPYDKMLPHAAAHRPQGLLDPLEVEATSTLPPLRLRLRTIRLDEAGQIEEEIRASWRERLLPAADIWQRVPTVPKWGAAVVSMLLLAILIFPGAEKAAGTVQPPSADGLTVQWASMQQSIMRRAAISLTDDFRTGLADWEGNREDWAKSWSYDNAGFVRTGDLAVYSPSQQLSDYRVEFLGQIEKRALSWVVRAADLENYQVVKIVLSDNGPVPRASVVRFPVVGNRQGPAVTKQLPMPVQQDTLYRVLMEMRGPNYVLSVQGQVVDHWTETRFASGGVGFYSAEGERARLRWVGVWHQYDTLGRLCAYLSPYSMTDRERSVGQ